ncbi:MAG: L-rhamnose mutarotase [Clostridia bacterium]|nr:L-rhamnose mutarotase [Clostridia bacterium]
MQKYAWKAQIKEGCLNEYIRRHNDLWPEMRETLLNAGIENYTIWNVGNEMFGYYECKKGIEYAARYQAESDVVKKWNEYMKDILIMEMDPITGAQPLLVKVFEFN